MNKQISNKKFLKRQYSRQPLITYVPSAETQTVFPDFNFQAVIEMANNDPVVRGALTHFIDKCMEGGYKTIKKDTYELDKEFSQSLDEKYLFRTQVLRKLFITLKYFNNAFIEIVRDSNGHTKSLNVLDSNLIEPITEFNGDPIRYKSRIPNIQTGKFSYWDKSDMVWVKLNDRSVGFAPVDLRSLWEALHLKTYITRYVAWLWKTGQYRVLYNFTGAGKANIDDFLAYARRHEENFKAPFLMKGDVQTRMLRDIKEAEQIVNLLKWVDNQLLLALRIPPLDVGIPDASGRSSGDSQTNNLSTHITSVKKVAEDYLSYDLFPKINKGNNLFVFGPNDRFSERQIFENMNIMRNIGMTDDVISEYLGSRGMYFESKLFEKKEEVKIKKDKDLMPSRFSGEEDPRQNIGTGEQSSTREDQLAPNR